MGNDFLVINISAREKGLLKTTGNREVVASIKMIQGADNADDDWLMESVKNIYMQYYSRVADYIGRKEGI